MDWLLTALVVLQIVGLAYAAGKWALGYPPDQGDRVSWFGATLVELLLALKLQG